MSCLYEREFSHWMRLQVRKHRQLLRWCTQSSKVRASMISRFQWDFRLANGTRFCGPISITACACPPYGGAGIILTAYGVRGWDRGNSADVRIYVSHDDRDLVIPLIHRLCNDNSLKVTEHMSLCYTKRLHTPDCRDALLVGNPGPWLPPQNRAPDPGEWYPQKTPWHSTAALAYQI